MQKIQENVPIKSLTTFEIGGIVRYLVDVRSEGEILEALSWAKEHSMRHFILAGGSNVVMPDGLIDALIIRIKGDLWSVSGTEIDVWGGTNLLHLIQVLGAQGIGGSEKLAGIPGSVGGAIRGNAGAFGSEIKDFVVSVRALNIESAETRIFTNPECDFSYRHSYFKDHPEWVVTRAVLGLLSVDPGASANAAAETINERERRHLQNVRAAGSYFMNPVAPREIQELFEREKGVASREGRVPAGWLIEKAGMKGAVVGGAMASMQHPNYLVNTGSAKTQDVLQLAERVKAAVFEMFKIELEEEAVRVSFD
ncbi:MAG: hypothetical protein RIQ56_230 [Candidatus Parcubacteria bacterium]